MKIPYSFRKYQLSPSVSEDMTIDLPDEYALVQVFLHTTIHDDESGKWVLDGIDKVIEGQSEYEERDGEDIGLNIKKDMTVAYDVHAADKGEKRENIIDTAELRELVEIWTKAISEFNVGKKTS